MNINDFLMWDEDELEPETEEDVFGQLFQAIANNEGAGCFFVQCTDRQEVVVLERLRERFGRVSELVLNRESVSVYGEAQELLEREAFDVLVVRSLDDAILGYEDAKRSLGWDATALHRYDPRDVPQILHHLNQMRECWRDRLLRPVVFLVSPFVVQYLILRCADFYDWRVGTFILPIDESDQQQTLAWTKSATFRQYRELSTTERFRKVAELRDILKGREWNAVEAAELLVELGLLLESGDEYGLALSYYDQAIVNDPNCVQAYRNQADVFRALGRIEAAVASYDRALELKPDDHEAWYNRGIALGHLGQYEAAVASYDRALEIKPDYYYAWNGRGNALRNLGQYEAAVASYDRALEIKPDYLFAWSQRGLALENLQRYPEAETAYRKALSITERAFDYRNLGDVLRRQERYEESISSYTKALELDTDYSDVRYELGWTYACYLKPPNYAAAREVFESCLERNDSDPEAFYGFACIDSLQNNFEASLTHLQRAIEIDPSYRDRAKNDTDFDPIRHDPRFQALLNP